MHAQFLFYDKDKHIVHEMTEQMYSYIMRNWVPTKDNEIGVMAHLLFHCIDIGKKVTTL